MSRTKNALAILTLASACSSSTPPPQPPPPPSPSGNEVVQTPPPPPPPPPMARARVIHAAPITTPNVDVYADGNAAISNFAFQSVRGYMNLPAGEHALTIRAAGVTEGDALFTGSTPSLEADRFYTVIAHGLAAGDPRLSVTAALDDRTAPPEGQARVRFFHALVGVSAVDVCVAGATARAQATPLFTNVAYGGWGEYANVPAAAVSLQVRAQHARPCRGAVIGAIPVTPVAGVTATAIAVGNPTATPVVAPALLVCSDASESSCAPIPVQLARRGRR